MSAYQLKYTLVVGIERPPFVCCSSVSYPHHVVRLTPVFLSPSFCVTGWTLLVCEVPADMVVALVASRATTSTRYWVPLPIYSIPGHETIRFCQGQGYMGCAESGYGWPTMRARARASAP